MALRQETISIKEQLNPLPERTAFGHLKFSETLKGFVDEISALSDKKSGESVLPARAMHGTFRNQNAFQSHNDSPRIFSA